MDNYTYNPGDPLGDPLYQTSPKQQRKSVFAIISLICGIVTVSISCCGLYGYAAGLTPGIASIVMAIIEKCKRGEMSTFSKVGMTLGIAGLALGIIACILYFVFAISIELFLSGPLESFDNSYYYYY